MLVNYNINVLISLITFDKCTVKRAASAPSITRWSYDIDNGNISLGSKSLPFHLGFISDFETPKIATSGALTIGVNAVPPIPPKLEMVKQPPYLPLLICHRVLLY